MALDFPSNPTVGQTYTSGGTVWTWDGAKWVTGMAVGVGVAPIDSPVFTGNPTAPNQPAGDKDTSIANTAFVNAAVAPAFNGVGRNLIHNPLFNIAQRGAGPFTTAGATTLDRWLMTFSGDTLSVATLALSDTDRSQIGDEAARQAVVVTATGTAGASTFSILRQAIEGVTRLTGKTITLSFWAKTASGTLKLGASVDESFGTGGSPSAVVEGAGQQVTLNPAWARYSLTFALPSAAGKTLGTVGNDRTEMIFWFSSGTNTATRAGNIGVQSGAFGIWGVQLEIGSVATPLEKPDPRYDLSNCQRFFWTGQILLGGYNVAGGGISASWPYTVTPRAQPTIVITSNSSANVGGLTASPLTGGIYMTGSVTATGPAAINASFTASADL